eukprot:scaffold3431_cov157-Skeletonema_dohrnii-CCMP3373.AAC.2
MNLSGLALALALTRSPVVAAAANHRSLRADTVGLRGIASNGMASYDAALGIPKCNSEGTSCDTGALLNGRGAVHPELNYPNTLDTTNCLDGISGGISDESVDRIVVRSESGGYMTEEESVRITATVNCWADGWEEDYVYFYHASVQEADSSNNWNFIEKIPCPGAGLQTLTTSYTLPKGSEHVVRISIRYVDSNDFTSNSGSCGIGSFDDNDDVAFTVVTATLSPNITQTLGPKAATTPEPSTTSPSSSASTATATPTPNPSSLSTSTSPSLTSSSSLQPTVVSSLSPSMSRKPTSTPSLPPSVSLSPTSAPSNTPSASGTILSPTKSPFVLFTYGESLYRNNDLDIQISVGLTATQIAQSGSSVSYANGGQSSRSYHGMMDGAGIAQLPDGGYAYLSNAEKSSGNGGVYGLYFNKDGEIIDYKALLTGTSRNCGGGMSPWNTWISCEEVGSGQCWQVEPDPNKPNHNSPKPTLLGGPSGGSYETVAVDNTNENKPIFFTTEDKSNGELRRFEADGNGWDALHVGGQTTYLQFLSGNRFHWTSNIEDGKSSAWNHYPNAEGIIYHNSTIYFVAKVTRTLFILDLNDMTYTSERTGSSWVGQGAFNSQPDQIIESDLDKRKYIYFTEDGGNAPGVHVRDREGNYYTMVRGVPGGRYSGDETVGIAFSPDRRKFYFGFQDAGVLMEVTRDDGHAFN